MTKIFLSYARADRDAVQPVAELLDAAGHDVWWDRRIGGGVEFAAEIESALNDADLVLVCWSANAHKSHWVRDEAAAGRDTARLLPATLDGTPPPLGFRQFQTIDLSGWDGRPDDPPAAELLECAARKRPGSRARAPAGARPPRGKSRLWPLIPISAGVMALAFAVGAALYWPGEVRANSPPELEITKVDTIGGNIDATLAGQFNQELRAILAADNAIIVSSAEEGSASDARFALAESISRAGDLYKVAVELTDRESGVMLWSKILEVTSANAVAAPRQASYKVGTVVRCALTSRSQRLSGPALTQWVALCYELWANPDPTTDGALQAARKATDAAPNFSEAWSARAMFAAPLPGDSAIADQASLRREARESAERALRLDPDNGQAYAAKAMLLPSKAYREREELLKKATSVRPTDCVCEAVMYAGFLLSVGRVEESYAYFRRVRDMRPSSRFGLAGQALALFILGRDDDARQTIADGLSLWPDHRQLKLIQIRGAIWSRRYGEGLAVLDDPTFKVSQLQRDAWRAALEALQSGNVQYRAAALRTLVEMSKQKASNTVVGIAAIAGLGAPEQALAAAQRLISDSGPDAASVLFEPTFAEVRQSAEFAALAERLGIASYWASSGSRPDLCKSRNLAPVCRAA